MSSWNKKDQPLQIQKHIFCYSYFQQAGLSFGFFRLANKTYKTVGRSYSSLTLFVTPKLMTVEKVEYFKAFNLFLLILLISLLLFGIAYFLSMNTIKDSEKLSQYECGFEPFDEATRHPFDVHFYIVGILFLIFDVEIALLFPWVLGLKFLNWFGFFTMILFLAILTIGFFYEWHRGALTWPQNSISSKS
jgi:NADH-quinone oxidoreductase subunit A